MRPLLCLALLSLSAIFDFSPAHSAVRKKEPLSYSFWKPAISAKDVYQKFISFHYLKSFGHRLFWIEARPEEQGRFVIMKREKDGTVKELTPKGFSARTRVHEYGGSSYTVYGSNLYFVNFSDQRIYWQNLNRPSKLKPLTPPKNTDGSLGKYMDLTVSPDGKWLVFVYEKEYEKKENLNFIAAIDLERKTLLEPTILASGADFYQKPSFSKSKEGENFAWLQWDHPYMPWDSTELYGSRFQNGKIQKQRKIIGGDKTSIYSLSFGVDGALYFSMDWPGLGNKSFKNYYNVYKYQNGKMRAITKDLGEYNELQMTDRGLLATYIFEGEESLRMIDLKDNTTKTLQTPYREFKFLTANKANEWFAVVSGPTTPPRILNLSTQKTIKTAYKLPVGKENIPIPQKIKFPTQNGEFAYGYFYRPKNKNYRPLPNGLPPVRVLLHGGPTYRTSISYSSDKVFWSSQGYAIFDINYRGSTGYGRKYRDALLGRWGLVEIEDVKNGLAYLRKKNLIGSKSFVSGMSAGGYSVQRLLTRYPNLFQGGASYFGIGNLVTLQKLTHKFESRYLVQLIGSSLEKNQAEYERRSPINHLKKLAAPMILFQGSEDKIVPPENSREIANILKKRGIYHEYYEYEGEDHGFYKKENMISSLSKESAFFKKILRKR
ncbi:MAG: prolyl oligopeptidase family serine peptidase [Bacteriovoracales bacterium]|nr:prolyl oligopeptidase family serine peptidase [Bacteriovoracales bacterium]